MQNLVAISAMGENRPGLVEPLVKAFRECGCSIAESRLSVLGDRFMMMALLSGTWDAVAKIESMLPRLEQELDISIVAQRAAARTPAHNLMPYAVEVIAVDQVGIVHQIAQFFSHHDINIEDMYTGNYAAAHTGTPMFSLHMTISIPTDISIAAMRSEFMDFCDQLNLDAIMEPVK
ncbi:MAG: glycine cleavage system protein R [Gammaproteobacteria bacterium]|nr:glycine cleavage system protein R [Gammaproteobacteria bacterium]MCP5200709.1 glycine cleavage system protein R [Gammaproteobacteria bacterium]